MVNVTYNPHFAAFLGDPIVADIRENAAPPAFLHALDTLYGVEPEAEAVARAQSELRNIFSSRTQNAIYYDALPHTLVGTIFLAVNERGLLAVNFGMSEGEFVARIERRQ